MLLWLCFSFRVAVEECLSDLVPIVCTFRLSVLSGRLQWSLRSGLYVRRGTLRKESCIFTSKQVQCGLCLKITLVAA